MNIGDDIESKKCTIMALGDGAEWVAQGQPKRFPTRKRIDILVRGIRMGEIAGAEHDQEQPAGESTRVGLEIRSICHDIVTASHGRDYQALGVFLLPAVWGFAACEVAAID